MKRTTLLCILTMILLCSSASMFAQKTVINGKITSKIDGEPLMGATVLEYDKDKRVINGTTTNIDGAYQLTLSKPKTVLAVSYIGFKTIEMTIDATKQKMDFMLEDESVQIQSVEIVAKAKSGNTMMPVSQKDMATSVGALSAKDMAEVPVTSVGEMLQGRLSGVDITATSGNPGAGMSIRIRGASSLNGNSEPLIVVDGIPYETKIDAAINFATATEEEFGAMLDISPSDIQMIEVLKDAAACAVWGAKGANGVLVITTKRGERGRTSFEYDVKLTGSWEPASVPMLNGDQYSMLQLEALYNARGAVNVPNELAYNKMWSNYHNYSQNTDWIKAITKNAFTQEHNFSLLGGGEKARYRVAMGYLDQDGSTVNTGMQRLTARMNVDYFLSTRLKLSTDISYSNINNDRSMDDLRNIAYRKAPNMSIYEKDMAGQMTGKYFSPETSYQGAGTTYYNPVAMARDGINNLKTNRVISTFSLRYYFVPEILMYQGDISFDYMNNIGKIFIPQSATGAAWTSSNMNRATKKDDEASTSQTFNKLILTPNLGDNHRLTVLGMLSTYTKSNDSMTAQSSNTPVSSIIEPGAQSRKSYLSSGKNTIRNLSYMFNVNYVAYDKYILSGSIRADGDSRFGKASRWGYFPSLSLAWRLSNEKFLKQFSWLEDLKIKASYGENGTPPPTTYGFLSKYSASGNYMDMNAIVPVNIQLDNLKWETVIQRNFGIDYAFFKGKISGSYDLYTKRTKDVIFVNTALPSTSGFASLDAKNWGTIENKGWEFNIAAEVYRNKNWTVTLNANFAQNKNYIMDIPEGYQTESYTYDNGQYARRIQVGKPMGSIFGYRYQGVYSTETDVVVKDRNQQVVINPLTNEPVMMRPKLGSSPFVAGDAKYQDVDFNGIIDERDIVFLGDSNPLFTGGFGANITYKNFSLNTFFHFKYDYDVVNATRIASESMYNSNNQSTATLSRWRKPGDQTNIPRALYNGGFNWLGSDRFVEDASYIRLKTLTLSYKMDKRIVEKWHIKGLKFYLTAYNLFTWTKYTGQDPEIYLGGGDPFAIAMDYSKTPQDFSVTFGG